MVYRQLGRTDMRVSAISFGAWAIGGFAIEFDAAVYRAGMKNPQIFFQVAKSPMPKTEEPRVLGHRGKERTIL